MSTEDYWPGWGIAPDSSHPAAGDLARAAARVRQKRADYLRLLAHLKAEHPALVKGEPNQRLSEAQTRAIFTAASEASSNYQLRDRHNFLVRGLSRGVRELEWEVPVPAPISIYHAEKEILTPAAFRELAPYRVMQKGFWDHLNDDLTPVTVLASDGVEIPQRDLDAGQLLFSVITCGMLLSHYWITAWPEALARGVFVASGEGRQGLSLELRMADMAPRGSSTDFTQATMRRRWFPDAVTALLLQRWYRCHDRQWPSERPETLLRRYLKHLGLTRPTGSVLRWLMRQARTAAMLDMPHFVAHYAQSRDLGASLTQENYERLCTGLAPPHKIRSIESSGAVHRVREPDALPRLPETLLLSDQLASLSRLRHCVRRSQSDGKERSVGVASKALRRFLESDPETPPLVRLLAQWLKHRISAKDIKVSSALTYLSSIGKSLVVASVDQPDVAGYAQHDWQCLYERAMQESCSNNAQAYRCARLIEFHGWLIERFEVPPVAIEGERPGLRNVDAQVLTPREIIRARKWLASSLDRRLAAIRELVLILGYRCGLRRSEVASLRLQDLPGLLEPGCHHPELLVRNNLYATVKSPSSVRRLPLWLFLMDSELAQLRLWVRRRHAEQHQLSAQALLFCAAGEPLRMLTDTEVFAPIQRAMCNASGSADMRFHHNRHSFATFSLLRLMEHQPGDYIPVQWRLDDQQEVALPKWGESFSELARLGATGAPTRKHLWALSGWCGHLDPGESMASYLHLIDWLLGAMVRRRRNPELSRVAQANLLGVNPSGIDVIRNRHGIVGGTTAENLLGVVARRWSRFSAQNDIRRWGVPQCPELDPAQQQVTLDPLMLYQLLSTLEARHDNDPAIYDNLAESYGIEAFVIREWADRAAEMSQLESKRGTPRIRYKRTQKKKPSKAGGDNSALNTPQAPYAPSTECFPAPPRTKNQKAQVQRIFRGLQRIHEEDPDLVYRVLQSFLTHVQRSKTMLRLGDLEAKQEFLRLLDMLNLKKWAFVRVDLGLDKDAQEARRFWAASFEVPPARVQIKQTVMRLTKRNSKGIAHIDLHTDETGKRMLWDVVRFVMTAAAVCLPPASMVGGVLGQAD